MTEVLVTGGAGFIGSHVVEACVASGDHVRVLDDFSTGRMENLEAVRGSVDIVQSDVTDAAAVASAVRGCEYVIHLAAIASVQASLQEPRRTHQVNVDGTLNVLEAARQGGVGRVVFASSAAVYGDHTDLPLREGLAPRCLSPYAAHKLAGEAYCSAYYSGYGLSTTALRFFNVYGPRQDPGSPYTGVISIFADRMARGLRPIIFGDGKQTRDFVFVTDVAQAVLTACVEPKAAGRVLNIASGSQTTIQDLVATLNEVLSTDLEPDTGAPKAAEVRFSQGDASLAQSILRWRATVSLRDGFSRLLGLPDIA